MNFLSGLLPTSGELPLLSGHLVIPRGWPLYRGLTAVCFDLYTASCLYFFLSFFFYQACTCVSNLCLNGGTMQEEADGRFSCQCGSGWKGNRCERKNDSFCYVSCLNLTQLINLTQLYFLKLQSDNHCITTCK